MAGMETGPGPLRHPKPLTAVDLYSQLEKEQEAVVNRLTRELTLLRAAQNASVVSSTSSTSASGIPDSSELNASSFISGHSHPMSSQFYRHRSSSVASCRSINIGNSAGTIGCLAGDRGNGRTGHPPRHDISHVSTQANSGSNCMSRQNSGSRASFHYQNFSCGSSPINMPTHSNNNYPSHGRESWPSVYPSYPSRSASLRDPSSRSPALAGMSCEKEILMSNRIEEVALYRIELENSKRENEMLKRRVRELEAMLNQKKPSENASVILSYTNEDSDLIEGSSVHSHIKTEEDSGGVRLAQSTCTETISKN